MKLAITTSGTDLDAPVDVQFGRARGLAVVELDTQELPVPGYLRAKQCRARGGHTGRETDAVHPVQVIVTGYCGPKAFRALQAAGIRAYTGLTGGSICGASEQFDAGALQEATGADVQGHW
jgi:predicted Fe-Mo cluster-binding NifX family protein